MSYRHPLRQTQTADYYTSTKRQPSNASTVSSGYSSSSGVYDLSRTSTLSSTASSGYTGHKRGVSEATGMAPSAIESRMSRSIESSPDGAYKSVRQSLRPLPQPPAPTSPSHVRSGLHARTQSVDVLKTS
ncbi:hypothetical protein DL95DRAFT_383197, partial [Leptodontidium sp. 2 PMI_412]